jgi:hypothetical protein
MKIMIKERFILFIAGLLLVLAGCDNGDDRSLAERPSFQVTSPNPNVSLASIGSPQKSEYRKGEPITINFSIASTKISADNVLVNFSVVPINELGKLIAGEETSDESMGDYLIESVTPGVTYFQADLVIPNNLIGGKEFVILGVVDPDGVMADDGNFEDNLSRGFNADFTDPTTKVITITDTFINDLSIENAAVGKGFILLETPLSAFPDGQSSTNILLVDDDPRESNAVGHIDVKKLGADSMNAIIQVDVIVEGEETAAFMWKGENDEWVNEAPYDVPSPNDSHFVPWDIRLSPNQRAALWAAYDPAATENIATFRFRIQQTSGVPDENPANNLFELEVPFRFFTPSGTSEEVASGPSKALAIADSRSSRSMKTEGGLSKSGMSQLGTGVLSSGTVADSGIFAFDRSYSQTYGDKNKFAVGLTAQSINKINGPAGMGRIYNTATVNAYALGKSLELAHAYGNAEADALGGTAEYRGYMRVFRNVVLDQSDSRSTDISREWSLQWREEQIFAQATFFAGPIPIQIKGGARGTMGFGAGLGISGGIDGAVIEGYGDLFFAQLDAFASGGVDLGIASGGVTVDLLLLQHRFRVSGAADLSKISNREITLRAVAQNEIQSIRGTFSLYANYTKIKWCCKKKNKTATLTLYSTGTLFSKNWDLLNESRTVSF